MIMDKAKLTKFNFIKEINKKDVMYISCFYIPRRCVSMVMGTSKALCKIDFLETRCLVVANERRIETIGRFVR